MRLIDADAFKARLGQIFEEANKNYPDVETNKQSKRKE